MYTHMLIVISSGPCRVLLAKVHGSGRARTFASSFEILIGNFTEKLLSMEFYVVLVCLLMFLV